MRRVVVTGLGLVTPLGVGVGPNWRRLIAGESGIGPVSRCDVSDISSRVAGEVPREGEAAFDPLAYVSAKDRRKLDIFMEYAIAAGDEAMAQAGWRAETERQAERAGVLIGSGVGGLNRIQANQEDLTGKGVRRISPFFIPSALINLASGWCSMRHDLRGPNHAVVTACSTGAHAIGDAARMIMLGDADLMLAGGAESTISRLGIGGFAAARALSTGFNDTPERASRPFDRDRDGFVIGEGAGVVVLEDREQARARGAEILAEVTGYGMSGDAYHLTAPRPDGSGAFRAMRAALERAGLAPGDIDYINAHGTSTPMGDEIEVGAVRRLFGESGGRAGVGERAGPLMSSTKSAIGHLLGAAGAVEAIYAILSMRHGVVPPTLNLDHVGEGCEGVDLVPHRAREHPVRHVLSNSFGFGGTNASLVLSAPS